MLLFIPKRLVRIFVVICIVSVVFIALQNVHWVLRVVYPFHYRDLIETYAEKYDVDPYLMVSIMRNESKFNPNALSRRDAKGLMQIAPITGQWAAERLNIEDYEEEMLYEPELNVRIGAWYLNILHGEFGDRLEVIVAAYNAGNGNVSRWLENPEYSKDGETLDAIPFGETRIYLQRVMRDYELYQKIYK